MLSLRWALWATWNEVPCCIERQSNFLPHGSHNYTQKANIGFSVPHVEITFDYRIDWQKEVTGFQYLKKKKRNPSLEPNFQHFSSPPCILTLVFLYPAMPLRAP